MAVSAWTGGITRTFRASSDVRGGGFLGGAFMVRVPVVGGKEDGEAGSGVTAGRALHFNFAADFVHDALDNPQADAGPLLALGAEERLEDNLQILWRYTATGV